MSEKVENTKKKKHKKPKQGHLLVWIALAVVLIPTVIIGVIVMTSTENSGSPVVGSRFSETDLNPAISEDQIAKVQEAVQFDGVEGVEVNLKSATLRINLDLTDSINGNQVDYVKEIAEKAYEEVDAILPVKTYFTQKEDGKMYDLSINVFNYAQVSEEQPADNWVYVCLTKTSASEQKVVDVLSEARDVETAKEVMKGSAAA